MRASHTALQRRKEGSNSEDQIGDERHSILYESNVIKESIFWENMGKKPGGGPDFLHDHSNASTCRSKSVGLSDASCVSAGEIGFLSLITKPILLAIGN